MDVENQNTEAPQAEDSRRAMLEQGFEAIEKGEPVETIGQRDEKGRLPLAKPSPSQNPRPTLNRRYGNVPCVVEKGFP